jgi:hypothetical protein
VASYCRARETRETRKNEKVRVRPWLIFLFSQQIQPFDLKSLPEPTAFFKLLFIAETFEIFIKEHLPFLFPGCAHFNTEIIDAKF